MLSPYYAPKFTAKTAYNDCFVVAVDSDVVNEEDLLTALSAGFVIAARNTRFKLGLIKGHVIIPNELMGLPIHNLVKAAFGDRTPNIFLLTLPEGGTKNMISHISHACSVLGDIARIRGIVRVKATKVTVAIVDISVPFSVQSNNMRVDIAC